MFSDAVSTINQMTSIIQGEMTGFSAQQMTIFGLVTAITSIIGCLMFLWLSKRFKIRTKTSLLLIVGLTGVVPLWGCFGIHFENFGIRVITNEKKKDIYIFINYISFLNSDPSRVMGP